MLGLLQLIHRQDVAGTECPQSLHIIQICVFNKENKNTVRAFKDENRLVSKPHKGANFSLK